MSWHKCAVEDVLLSQALLLGGSHAKAVQDCDKQRGKKLLRQREGMEGGISWLTSWDSGSLAERHASSTHRKNPDLIFALESKIPHFYLCMVHVRLDRCNLGM